MFGIFGFAFPAGLVLYWTVSNLFQIGQQAVMLRLGHIGPAGDGPSPHASEGEGRTASPEKPRRGFMGQLMERAEKSGNAARANPSPCASPLHAHREQGGTLGRSTKGGGSGRPKGSGPNRPKRPGR